MASFARVESLCPLKKSVVREGEVGEESRR